MKLTSIALKLWYFDKCKTLKNYVQHDYFRFLFFLEENVDILRNFLYNLIAYDFVMRKQNEVPSFTFVRRSVNKTAGVQKYWSLHVRDKNTALSISFDTKIKC
jgi:hypothetical protein